MQLGPCQACGPTFLMAKSPNLQNLIDTAVAGGALSSPWWVQYLQNGLELVALGGGIVLAGLRIRMAVIELRNSKQGKQTDENQE